jgi:hypothetical protein
MGLYNPNNKGPGQIGIYFNAELNELIRSAIKKRPHLKINEIVRNGAYMYLEKIGAIPPSPADNSPVDSPNNAKSSS